MSNEVHNLAVILARAGSKRLPRKNILPLGGVPLIGHAILAAKKAKLIDSVLVSTDSEEIATIARSLGAEVPFIRPPQLALDTTTSDETIIHAVNEFERIKGVKVQNVILLQPTSPFTKPSTIDACIQMVTEKGFKSALTVTKPAKRCEWIGRINSDIFENFISPEEASRLRLEDQFAPSGNVYIGKRINLEEKKTLIIKNESAAIVVDQMEGLDIDYELEFKFAEFLLTEKN